MRKSKGSDRSYAIGYAKPPKHSQYQPGRSGNMQGRPKGSRNRVPSALEDNRLRAMISEEADREITATDAKGRTTTITTTRAVLRSVRLNALKGQHRSQKLFLELVAEEEQMRTAERLANFETWSKYKRDWGPTFRRSPPFGQFPHPNDVILDFDSGVIRFAGPVSKEEVPTWERWRAIRGAIQQELEFLMKCRVSPDLAKMRGEIEGAINAANEVLSIIDIALRGTRTVIRILEELDLPPFGSLNQKVRKRLEKKHDFIFVVVHQAMKQYQASIAKRRHRFQ